MAEFCLLFRQIQAQRINQCYIIDDNGTDGAIDRIEGAGELVHNPLFGYIAFATALRVDDLKDMVMDFELTEDVMVFTEIKTLTLADLSIVGNPPGMQSSTGTADRSRFPTSTSNCALLPPPN